MTKYDYDVLVVGGGGSAGFSAAGVALARGLKTGMIEGARQGGLCIQAGCMPSKTLLHGASQRDQTEAFMALADQSRLAKRKSDVVEELIKYRERMVQAKQQQGLSVITGWARLKDEHSLTVDGKGYSFKSLVLGTGSEEFIPNIPGLSETGFLVAQTFLNLQTWPKSLAVIGGGAIGLELAQFSHMIGADVTILQRDPRLYSREAPWIGEVLEQALASQALKIITSADIKSIKKTGDGRKQISYMHNAQEKTCIAEEILLATGRIPRWGELDPTAAGLALEKGAIKVDKALRTNHPHIMAAGDVTGIRMVVNLAILQGLFAGQTILTDNQDPVDDAILPQALYTNPQMARVGLNQSEALAKGYDAVEVFCDLAELAVTLTYPQPPIGRMALRADKKSGLILGAEIIMPEASLAIHQVVQALALKATAKDMADLNYAHPCWAELIKQTALRLKKALG